MSRKNKKSLETTVSQFCEAYRAGRVCVHPTDTIPGLTADPQNFEAMEKINQVKGRESGRSMIALVGSLQQAEKYWAPLPEIWKELLAYVWPTTLSVAWAASDNAPESLIDAAGTICFRMPRFAPQDEWMQQVLMRLPDPPPTTSVNVSSQPPASTMSEAREFAALHNIYCPGDAEKGRMKVLRSESGDAEENVGSRVVRLAAECLPNREASSVIQIHVDASFSIWRRGKVSDDLLVGDVDGARNG